MSSTTVAIELLHDRIDIAAVKNGRITAARRLSVDLPNQANEWSKSVRALADVIRPVVEEFGANGARTAVFYKSPTQAVDLTSYELRSAAEACHAAILTCTDALPYAAGSAVCRAVAVGRDRAGANSRTHVVVAADRTDAVRAVVEFVKSAGLTFESLTPMDAVILARLIGSALRSGDRNQGCLHFGENSSFFVVSGGGAVRFERTIGIGLRTIAQSLTRPIRLPGGDESVELNGEAARKILHDHGIPDTDEIVHEDPPLTRRHIMPLIQPVLQRLIIELRQSLRFGIPNEEERKAITVSVTGPGTGVPGFTGLLGWELRIDVNADESHSAYDYREPASCGGELVDAIADRRSVTGLNLQPAEIEHRRTVEGLRRYLWAGAAAALVLLGADWFRYQSLLTTATRKAEVLRTSAAAIDQMEQRQERLLVAIGAMNAIEAKIIEEIGSQASLHAVLKEMSLLTPSSVRLTAVNFKREPDGMKGRASGRALPIQPPDLRTALQSYVDSLKASPIIGDVVLRNVTVDPMGPSAGQRFEAAFVVLFGPEPDGGDEVALQQEQTRP